MSDASHIAKPLASLRMAISKLNADPANARKHDQRNIDAIAASLAKFGQRKPIVVQRDGMVVRAGNGTVQAAKSLGWSHVAAVVLDDDNATASQYAIADNRTAELAEWDNETLTSLLDVLEPGDRELLGFDESDMQALMDGLDTATPEVVEDETPEPPADPITQPGDLWTLGNHRLLCGDSRNADDVARLMAGQTVQLCFTSPPYAQQRNYGAAKSCVEDWDGLMQGVFANLPMATSGQVLVNLGIVHREGEWWPYWDGWIDWMRSKGWRRFGWYVWDQGAGLPGDWSGRLGPSHEFVFHFNRQHVQATKWVACKPENVDIGRRSTARRQSGQTVTSMRGKDGVVKEVSSTERNSHKVADSVIRVSRCATIDMARESHPATFPIPFAAHILQSWPGDVFEPFGGSGTTLIAAEQLGRTCYSMEIDPAYCDVVIERWEALTGKKATRGK